MTSKDIYNRIIKIETSLFGLKIIVNSNYGINCNHIEAINEIIELKRELYILKDKLININIRKEKLKNLNNI